MPRLQPPASLRHAPGVALIVNEHRISDRDRHAAGLEPVKDPVIGRRNAALIHINITLEGERHGKRPRREHPRATHALQKHERLEAGIRHDVHIKAGTAIPPPERRQLDERAYAGGVVIKGGNVNIKLESIAGSVECVGFNRRRELPPRPVYVGKGNPTAAIGHTPARSQIIHMLSRRETFRQYVGNPLHGSTDESEIHNPPAARCVCLYIRYGTNRTAMP